MYCIKLETLGLETTSVILSCAVLKFNSDDEMNYKSLYDRSLFVKFSIKDQIKNYGRTYSQETIKWWKTQNEKIQEMNFLPSSKDVNVIDGLVKIREYMQEKDDVFARNSDAYTLSSLCREANQYPLFYNNKVLCTKTAIKCLKMNEMTINELVKYNPVSEICNDVINLLV